MINSQVTQHKKEEEDSFPKLMVSKEYEYVVLFSSPGKGTVVSSGNALHTHKIGYYTSGWHMPCFAPFNGKVTLENAG